MFVGASAAWHLLRGNDSPAIRKMLSMAMWMALLVAPIQAVVGDMHGLNTLEHQPAKIAPSKGTGKIAPARPRRCCCLACRIWSRSGPAMVWRSPLSAA
jgi:cytochrome bd-type quinol oxidase subunit 1